MSSHVMKSTSFAEAGLRWAARALSAAIVGLVVVMFIGTVGAGFHPLQWKIIETFEMLFFLLACVGMMLGWRWQNLGGALSVSGLVLFLAAEYAAHGRFPKQPFLYLMLLPGFLFLASALLGRHKHEHQQRNRNWH
jgi:hypothetical protein